MEAVPFDSYPWDIDVVEERKVELLADGSESFGIEQRTFSEVVLGVDDQITDVTLSGQDFERDTASRPGPRGRRRSLPRPCREVVVAARRLKVLTAPASRTLARR